MRWANANLNLLYIATLANMSKSNFSCTEKRRSFTQNCQDTDLETYGCEVVSNVLLLDPVVGKWFEYNPRVDKTLKFNFINWGYNVVVTVNDLFNAQGVYLIIDVLGSSFKG